MEITIYCCSFRASDFNVRKPRRSVRTYLVACRKNIFTINACGIGKHLLEYVKQTHSTLSLGVYQKNKRAVSFYLREGFSILSEELDEATGETEYTMIWKEKMENN